MKKAQLVFSPIEPSDNSDFTTLTTSIKAKLLAGQRVLVVDYQPQHRQKVIGAIAALRDDLPIVTGWQTLRQSCLSETRTRARCYRIPEALLQEVQV